MKQFWIGLVGVVLVAIGGGMGYFGSSHVFTLVVGLLYYVGVILAIGLGLIILAIVLQG